MLGEDDDGDEEGGGYQDVNQSADADFLVLIVGEFVEMDEVVADGGGEGGERAVGAGVACGNQSHDEYDGGERTQGAEYDFGIDAVGLVALDESAEVDTLVLSVN